MEIEKSQGNESLECGTDYVQIEIVKNEDKRKVE